MVTCSQRCAVAVQNVERRDHPGLRGVGGIIQLVLCHQLAHRLQIRAGDHQETIGFQYPQEFLEHLWHLVGIDVLDVEADFLLLAALKCHRQLGAVVSVAGADVEDGTLQDAGIHGFVAFFGFDAAVQVDQGVFELAGEAYDVHQR